MKLTKSKAIDFLVQLTGFSKHSISKNIHRDKRRRVYSFTSGQLRYDLWVDHGHIYCQLTLAKRSIYAAYFDYYTYEVQKELTEIHMGLK